jgi:hypothetical protein
MCAGLRINRKGAISQWCFDVGYSNEEKISFIQQKIQTRENDTKRGMVASLLEIHSVLMGFRIVRSISLE